MTGPGCLFVVLFVVPVLSVALGFLVTVLYLALGG